MSRWNEQTDFSDYEPKELKVCIINGCGRMRNARGLCRNHYQSAVTQEKRERFMNIKKIKLDGKIEITFEKNENGNTIYLINGMGKRISTDRKEDLEKIVREMLDKNEN